MIRKCSLRLWSWDVTGLGCYGVRVRVRRHRARVRIRVSDYGIRVRVRVRRHRARIRELGFRKYWAIVSAPLQVVVHCIGL